MSEWLSTIAPVSGISVVVPTCRRPDLLERCLDALIAQDLDSHDYEIIVADDACATETRRQVEQLACRSCRPIRYLRVDCASGPAAARNVGWRAARGEIIAFTDDDCIPAGNWLRAGLAAFDAGRVVDGAAGKLVVPLPAAPTDYERNAAEIVHADFVTANCFYRRGALEEVGGFDERFLLAWREDTDLYFRLMRCGYRLVRTPDAVAVHPVRPAGWGISLRQQRKSMYNALLYQTDPDLYRDKIQPYPPWHYYAIAGALLASLAGAATRRRRLATGGASLWFGLTARFCARRLRDTSHRPGHVTEMIVTSVLIPPLSIFWRLRGAVRFRVWFL